MFPKLIENGFERADEISAGFIKRTGGNEAYFFDRSKPDWRVVCFRFDQHGRAFCHVEIGNLPPECIDGNGIHISQSDASIAASPSLITLSRRPNRSESWQKFGFVRHGFFDQPNLKNDISFLSDRVPDVLEHFGKGFPTDWQGIAGRVIDQYFVLVWDPASNLRPNKSVPSGSYYLHD